jgi:hypothetical protein
VEKDFSLTHDERRRARQIAVNAVLLSDSGARRPGLSPVWGIMNIVNLSTGPS